LAPQPVDGPVARGGDDPPGRAGRRPGGWPPPDCLRESVLHRVFGDIDIAEDAVQDGHGTAVFLAEHALDLRGSRDWHLAVSPRLRPGTGGPRSGPGTPGWPCGPTRARRPGRRP